MSRTKNEVTKVQLAATAARAAYDTAKVKSDATKKADDIAATATAKGALDTAVTAENRERFEMLAGGRVAKVLEKLAVLSGCADKRTYEYSAADVEKAFTAILEAVGKAKGEFTNALAGVKTASGPAFKF